MEAALKEWRNQPPKYVGENVKSSFDVFSGRKGPNESESESDEDDYGDDVDEEQFSKINYSCSYYIDIRGHDRMELNSEIDAWSEVSDSVASSID